MEDRKNRLKFNISLENKRLHFYKNMLLLITSILKRTKTKILKKRSDKMKELQKESKECSFLNGKTCYANREYRRGKNKIKCSKCSSLKREPIRNK